VASALPEYDPVLWHWYPVHQRGLCRCGDLGEHEERAYRQRVPSRIRQKHRRSVIQKRRRIAAEDRKFEARMLELYPDDGIPF
jgi:hypothetical protein